jgi:hypothetical protein
MSHLSRRRHWAGTFALLTLAILGCQPQDRDRPASPTEPRALLGLPIHILNCPTSEDLAVTGVVSPDSGGTLQIRKWKLQVPPGAVTEPTEITMRVPAGNAVQVQFTANGADHLQFRLPVTVTASYERCLLPPLGVLIAWYWEPATGALLQPMPSRMNLLQETVTFWTDHFSGFVIAN